MEDKTYKEHKAIVKSYFEKLDSGKAEDPSYFDLFTENAELYFPKFGYAKGKEGIRRFGKIMGNHLNSIHHDIDNFNYISDGNYIVVEGKEGGTTTQNTKWPDDNISHGLFCNVFEFEGNLIKRVHIYVDPDFTSDDKARIAIFNNRENKLIISTDEQTRQVVNQFFEILSGKSNQKIGSLFADKVDWDMPGNVEKFNWLGKRSTKNEAVAFFEQHPKQVKQEKFEIDFIAINGENAVAVGNLSANILKYNKVYNSEFTAIFQVKNGKIVKYHFLEDSYKLNEMMK